MNKFYNIVKLFSTTKEKKSYHKEKQEKNNSITFEITENSDVKIKLNFELESEDAAYYLGIFLNQLTTGDMSQSIMDIMIDLSKDYPEYGELVKNSLLVWAAEINKKQSLNFNKPIISPTQFSTASRG